MRCIRFFEVWSNCTLAIACDIAESMGNIGLIMAVALAESGQFLRCFHIS